MATKPLQFHVPEKFRKEIETWTQDNDMTISEFLRQSVRFYMVLRRYMNEGYTLILREKGGNSEKELILP